MKSEGLSDSSIGVYLRNLRTVFNKAISDNVISADKYAFGKNKYTPPSTRNIKKALSLADIKAIYEYNPLTVQERFAKDFWFFSYFANGLNIKDICLLKYKNIIGEELILTREKTKNSRKDNQQKIAIFLTKDLQDIIDRQGNTNTTYNNYIFKRIISPNPTTKEVFDAVNQTVRIVNKYMKRIAERIGLSRIPTTNFARHSYSTVLKRAGVPIEMISENLGHSSIRTTQIYVDSFEKDQRKEVVKHLTAFKTEPIEIKKLYFYFYNSLFLLHIRNKK